MRREGVYFPNDDSTFLVPGTEQRSREGRRKSDGRERLQQEYLGYALRRVAMTPRTLQ